jgi:hypothetical protein
VTDDLAGRPIRCGNDPRVKLADGDQQAVDDFKAFLKAKRQWPRVFRLIQPVEGCCFHGVEFPSGRVVLDHAEYGLVSAAVSMEQLLAAPDMQGAIIERPEETHHGL